MVESGLRRELGRLVQRERESAGLSQAELATRAGITAANLNRIERASLAPSLDTIEKIFSALGLQLRLETDKRDDDLDGQLDRQSWLPLTERLRASGLSHLLDTLDGLPYVLDGALAANLHGVPLPIDALEVSVAWASADPFLGWLLRRFAYRFHERSGEFRMLDLDPRAPGPHYWQTSFGKVRARMCDELPGGVVVTVGEKAYRVRPLAEIELVDETTDRLLRRFRERLTTQPARRLEAV